jgi:uncharacterized protein (TIGR02145 family)
MKSLPFLFLLILTGSGFGYSQDASTNLNIGTFTDSRDGQIYKYVQIGTEIWMAENLKYLPNVSPSSHEDDAEKHYYVSGFEKKRVKAAQSMENFKLYGALYNWIAALDACPQGWHLPSDEEWKELEIFLGMNDTIAQKEGSRESGFIGNSWKSTTGWAKYGNGSNLCGLNVKPGGLRSPYTDFLTPGYGAYFWTSSRYKSKYAWMRGVITDDDDVSRTFYDMSGGLSVRCLKDH